MACLLGQAASASTDDDGDGIDDSADNCLLTYNPDQRDTNQDGFGNRCDPDLDNNNTVDFADFALYRDVVFTENADADFDGSGQVDILDLAIMRAFMFSAPGPTAAIYWINESDGVWESATNWDPPGIPGPNNRVVINLPAANPVITVADSDAQVYALSTRETLVVSEFQSLTVAGDAQLDGDFLLERGARFEAVGPMANVDISSLPVLQGSFTASAGALLSLSGPVELATELALECTADGEGSVLSMPNLIGIQAGLATDVTVDLGMTAANAGGITLPQVTDILLGARAGLDIRVLDAGSSIDMPVLRRFVGDGHRSVVQVDGDADLHTPLLQELRYVSLDIERDSNVNLGGLTTLAYSSIDMLSRVESLPNITDFTNSSVFLLNSASLQLPGIVNHISERAEWELLGSSFLGLPNLVHITTPNSENNGELYLQADSGSQIDLPLLAGAEHHVLHLGTDRNGSAIYVPQLQGIVGRDATDRSSLSATDGATIDILLPDTIAFVDLMLGGESNIGIQHITSWTGSRLAFADRTVALDQLSDITDSELAVLDGADVTLALIVDFVTTLHPTDWSATDSGSRLSVPNLATVQLGSELDVRGEWSLSAEQGGTIDLPSLHAIFTTETTSGNSSNFTVFTAQGSASRILLPQLSAIDMANAGNWWNARHGGEIDASSFTAMNGARVDVQNGGTFNMSQMTAWTNSSLRLSDTSFTAPVLTDIGGTGIFLFNADVTLPGVSSFMSEHGAGWEAQSSRLALPNLTDITMGVVGESTAADMTITATAGGVISMPLLTHAIATQSDDLRSIELRATGPDSTIEAPLLESIIDNSPTLQRTGIFYQGQSLVTPAGGTILVPALVEMVDVDFTLPADGNIELTQIVSCIACDFEVTGRPLELPNLTMFDGSTVAAFEGAQVTLPAVTTYETDIDDSEWRAQDEGSLVAFPALTSFSLGTDGSTNPLEFRVLATLDAEISFDSLLTVTVRDSNSPEERYIDITATLSEVSMPVLESFTDNDVSGTLSTIREFDGHVTFPDTAALTNVLVNP